MLHQLGFVYLYLRLLSSMLLGRQLSSVVGDLKGLWAQAGWGQVLVPPH